MAERLVKARITEVEANLLHLLNELIRAQPAVMVVLLVRDDERGNTCQCRTCHARTGELCVTVVEVRAVHVHTTCRESDFWSRVAEPRLVFLAVDGCHGNRTIVACRLPNATGLVPGSHDNCYALLTRVDARLFQLLEVLIPRRDTKTHADDLRSNHVYTPANAVDDGLNGAIAAAIQHRAVIVLTLRRNACNTHAVVGDGRDDAATVRIAHEMAIPQVGVMTGDSEIEKVAVPLLTTN